METLAQLYKAFSDETRLRIVNLLGEGELCVCDLMNVLDMPQSRVSRHVAYLRHAGWVRGKRSGKWMHYELSPDLTPFQQSTLESLGRTLATHPRAVADRENLARYLETKTEGQCG